MGEMGKVASNQGQSELDQGQPRESRSWNLWHGCHKKSEGCQHCYVYRRDAEYEKDSSIVTKTSSFDLPIRRNRQGDWKVPSGTLMWTCFTSDFFIEDADELMVPRGQSQTNLNFSKSRQKLGIAQWREDAWLMIQRRRDLHFFMITKRPERILECLPEDWGDGYEHVTICCTMENQRRVDERLPIYMSLPLKHKAIICEPLLGPIDFHGWLTPMANAASSINGDAQWCEQVTVGGESGPDARVCDYSWVLGIREQCIAANVPFHFKQTGAHFRKDGRLYNIPRKSQMQQAHRAGIDYKT
jgi:protein gp37